MIPQWAFEINYGSGNGWGGGDGYGTRDAEDIV
jgi:hypothetical protein